MTAERFTVYERVQDVMPAARNPKGHELGRLRKLIERFGFTQPLLHDERTGRLVAGHGRLTVLAQMEGKGGEPPDGIQVNDAGEWLVPVIHGWQSRSDTEAEAYLLADNRASELGGWVEGELAIVLQDLDVADTELRELVGWTDSQFQQLVDGLDDPLPSEGDAPLDDLPETWGVIVECDGEQEQATLLQRFTDEGLRVRALMS